MKMTKYLLFWALTILVFGSTNNQTQTLQYQAEENCCPKTDSVSRQEQRIDTKLYMMEQKLNSKLYKVEKAMQKKKPHTKQ